jgi:hypothetical protein
MRVSQATADGVAAPAAARRFGAPPVMAVAILLAVILLTLPFRTFSDFDRELVVWGTAVILVALAVTALVSARRRPGNPWLDPAFLIVGFFAYKYGFGTLAVNYWSALSWRETPGVESMFERWGIWEHLPAACQLFLLGGLGLYLGMALRPPRLLDSLPAIRWRFDERRFRVNLWIYTPIAMTLFVVGRRVLPLVIRDTALLFGWINWVLIVIASARLFARQETDRAAWLGIIAMIAGGHILLGLEIGMRGAFVYPLLLIGAGYVMGRGRVPWARAIGASVLLMAVVIPWLSFYKIQSTELPILERMRTATDEIAEVTARGALERGIEALIGRSVGVVGMTAVFIQDVPDLAPFEYGRTFMIQATHLVPRVIWPEKPNMSEQLNFYSRRAGLIRDDDESTSAVFDAVSEYYVNFGVAGVFFLSLLHGWYMRMLHHWLVVRSMPLIGGAMYLIFILINFDFFGVGQIALAHTRQIPVWIAALYVLSRDVRPAAGRPAP